MSTSSDGNIQVWDARNGEAIGPRFQGADFSLNPAISFDGKKLAYSKKLDRPIEVYEVDSGRRIVSIPSPQGQYLTKMMFDHDGQEILASYIDTPYWNVFNTVSRKSTLFGGLQTPEEG